MMGLGIIFLSIIVISIGLSVLMRDRSIVLIGVLVGLVSVVILLGVNLIKESGGHGYKTIPVKESEVDIYALKSGAGEDIFIGVQGGVEYYYIKEGELGKKMDKVKVESAYINEVVEGEPTMEVYKEHYENGIAKFIYGTIFAREVYVYNVPEGTVTTDFKIDKE